MNVWIWGEQWICFSLLDAYLYSNSGIQEEGIWLV